MLFGATLPFRMGERIGDDGLWTYDAITHIYFFGDWAFATGLTDELKPSHAREVFNKLDERKVTRLYYYSKGEKVVWCKGEKGRWRLGVVDAGR